MSDLIIIGPLQPLTYALVYVTKYDTVVIVDHGPTGFPGWHFGALPGGAPTGIDFTPMASLEGPSVTEVVSATAASMVAASSTTDASTTTPSTTATSSSAQSNSSSFVVVARPPETLATTSET